MNKARCNHCGDIIESRHQWDFQCCSCFKNQNGNTGIFIDGGNTYWRCGGNMANFERIKDEDSSCTKKVSRKNGKKKKMLTKLRVRKDTKKHH